MTSTAFLDTDLQVLAARARAALPLTVNSRIEKAVRLVQADSVVLHDDGTATVVSESDGITPYRVVGKSCACPDYTFQAPQGWCAHRIAVAIVQRPTTQAQDVPSDHGMPVESRPRPSTQPRRSHAPRRRFLLSIS